MKLIAAVIGTALLMLTASDLKASNSSVKLINKVNTTSTSSNNNEVETSYKVEIHQEGEGTSSVKFNDKEWKQEGPGDISVNESTNGEKNENKEENKYENVGEKNEDDNSLTPTPSEESEEDTENKNEELESSPFNFMKFIFSAMKEFLQNIF